MNIISNKINALKKHIRALNNCEVCLNSDDYDSIIHEAEEITKLAYFLKSYKELDEERKQAVKQVAMAYLNENNTYDSSLLKSIEYCFGECD